MTVGCLVTLVVTGGVSLIMVKVVDDSWVFGNISSNWWGVFFCSFTVNACCLCKERVRGDPC